MTSSQGSDAVVAELLHLEAESRRATTNLDVTGRGVTREAQATLAALMADEVTVTHIDGRTESKADYLAQAAGQVRSPLSGLRVTVDAHNMRVRLYGDVGVLTGQHCLRVEGRDPLEYVVTQVWVKRPPSWQLVAWQATRVRSVRA